MEVLREALHAIPDGPAPSPAEVKKLGKLVEGDQPLQSFLEHLLPQLCDLFGGVAAVAWMKAQGAPGAVFGVRYRMDDIVTTITEQKKHERLVQLAWQQRKAMLAEPAIKKSRKAVENPTDHVLLFAPVLHLGEPSALLEIVLDKMATPLDQNVRGIYLKALQLVAEKVYRGLARRMEMPAATFKQAQEKITNLNQEVENLQLQILKIMEARLQQFHGWSFESLADNQAFAKLIHQMLDSHGLRVRCPECGNPAILRCLRAGNAKHGAFVFDHYLESGRTFHGGPTTVPLLQIVQKPARRQ